MVTFLFILDLLVSYNEDCAVKSLCDIWPQQDIPTVYQTSDCLPASPMIHPVWGLDLDLLGRVHGSTMNVPDATSHSMYLPSPVSLTWTMQPSFHILLPTTLHYTQPIICPQLHQCETARMKYFVYEVLCRLCTSGTVLLTVLCYIKAIRAKVPGLVQKEKQFDGFSSLPAVLLEVNDSIPEAALVYETCLALTSNTMSSKNLPIAAHSNPIPSITDQTSLPSLPPLPSPLLCPRHTFLALLILAMKFMQDFCYSNWMWAKICGLPPHEVGHCKRALGEALEWRLWVGKMPAVQSTSGHALAKCKSDPPSPLGLKALSLIQSATAHAGSLLDGPHVSRTHNMNSTDL